MKRVGMAMVFGFLTGVAMKIVGDSEPASGVAWLMSELPILLSGVIYANCQKGSQNRHLMSVVFYGLVGCGVTLASAGKFHAWDSWQWWASALIIVISGELYAAMPRNNDGADENKPNNKPIEPA